MEILIAEDDPVSRKLLELRLKKWGFQALVCLDGSTAWNSLQQDNAPALAILDWMMPGMSGVDICRKVRQCEKIQSMYIILLTAREKKEDIIEGLKAGADDYVTKPFDSEELRVRLQAGVRIVNLQKKMSDRVKELEAAAAHIDMLQGFLPICCYCKKIRSDDNYWQQIESYISGHSEVIFSHGICPECYRKTKEQWAEEGKKEDLPGEV